VKSTLMSQTPATGLSCLARPRYVAVPHTAPIVAAQGTGLSFAGTSVAAEVAAALVTAGARSTDLPGSPPRGAPV
jgi:hypothetical protein